MRRLAEKYRTVLALSTLMANSVVAAENYLPAPWQLYRDANPFAAASGLPFAPPTIAPERWTFETVLSASNTEMAFERGKESLLYDAEIHEARIAVTHGFGEHGLFRATLASQRYTDGFLDGFIESFHRKLGFPRGNRDQLDSDGHEVRYTDADGERVLLDGSVSAIAPLIFDLAYRNAGERSEWLYGATVKLPTSRKTVLADDRALDASLWIAQQSTDAASRWSWGWRGGFMQRGVTHLLEHRARDRVGFADGLLAYRLMPGWDVAAQAQWHDALYDSALPLLRDAGTLTLSTGWRLIPSWSLRVGIVEDLPAEHAQDVTMFATFGYTSDNAF